MGDQRQLLDILMSENKANGRRQLLRGILRDAERRALDCGPVHFRITVGMTETVEVEPPDVEAGFFKRVAPRLAVKSMRDRKRRGKCRAVHIEYRSATPKFRIR